MRKRLQGLFAVTMLVAAGCSKSKTPGPSNGDKTNNIKFEIIGGNNKTLEVGYGSEDLPTVKLTGDGVNVNNYVVEFKGSGCNEDLKQLSHFGADGLAAVNYKLAGNVGAQTLQATLIETASSKRIDSLTFNFTATAPTAGIKLAACTPPFSGALSFAKTGTGRLFAVFGSGQNSVRYSDDDGVSWNPVKEFSSILDFETIRSDGKSQVAVYSLTKGIYYSPDNGTTWKAQSSPFQGKPVNSFSYTPTGKLFVVTFDNLFYYSADNGANWTQQTLKPGIAQPLYQTQEGPAGDFYVYVADVGIYKSTDQGKTWLEMPAVTGKMERDGTTGFYMDYKTGWLYRSAQIPSTGIYLSKDGGNTYSIAMKNGFSVMFFYVNKNVTYLEDGFGTSIYREENSNTFTKIVHDLPRNTLEGDMIVSDNGNVLWTGGGFLEYLKQ